MIQTAVQVMKKHFTSSYRRFRRSPPVYSPSVNTTYAIVELRSRCDRNNAAHICLGYTQINHRFEVCAYPSSQWAGSLIFPTILFLLVKLVCTAQIAVERSIRDTTTSSSLSFVLDVLDVKKCVRSLLHAIVLSRLIE